MVEEAAETPPPAWFVVYPENWAAVMLFVSLSSQWRIGGMGEVFGLDYAALEVVMRIQRLKDRRALWADVQVMESAALAVFAEARKKHQPN